nr:hypothetical protein EFPHDIBJ_EFPHDIBJ_CDS_0011 [Microvirus sp.]
MFTRQSNHTFRLISLRTSLNRPSRRLGNRNSNVRALLRAGKTGSEIVMVLTGDIRETTFRHIRDKGASIHTGNGGIIERHNKRVLEILVTEPLIHNQGIGPERKSINRKARNTRRNTKIIGNRTNLPTVSSRRNKLGNIVFRLRNPGGFRILAAKFLPVIPNQTIRHEEIIGVEIHVVHHRRKKSLHPDNLGTFHLEGIARKNLFHIKRNNIAHIERRLHTCGTVKPRARNINMGIKRKMRFRVTIHSTLPPSDTDSGAEAGTGAG